MNIVAGGKQPPRQVCPNEAGCSRYDYGLHVRERTLPVRKLVYWKTSRYCQARSLISCFSSADNSLAVARLASGVALRMVPQGYTSCSGSPFQLGVFKES